MYICLCCSRMISPSISWTGREGGRGRAIGPRSVIDKRRPVFFFGSKSEAEYFYGEKNGPGRYMLLLDVCFLICIEILPYVRLSAVCTYVRISFIENSVNILVYVLLNHILSHVCVREMSFASGVTQFQLDFRNFDVKS